MAKKSKGRSKKGARRKSGDRGRTAAVGSGAGQGGDSDGIEPADLSGLQAGKLYYRIGEVSHITGVKPYVLRYWESEFRLMAPQKSRSKQRLYRQKDIETILAIKRLLYEERYTIAGARRRLREMGGEARAEMAAEVSEADARRAVQESETHEGYRRIRAELLAIRSALSAEI